MLFLLVTLLLSLGTMTAQQCDYTDDFESFPAFTYSNNLTSPYYQTSANGWEAEDWCNHQEGSEELYLVGGPSKEYRRGWLRSPIFSDGCKRIKLSYKIPFNYINYDVKLEIRIQQEGATVWSDIIENNAHDIWHEYFADVNITGDFQVVIENKSEGEKTYPSNDVYIKEICITAKSKPAQCDYSAEIPLMPTFDIDVNYGTPHGTTDNGWIWTCCRHLESGNELWLNGGMIPYFQGDITSPAFNGGCKAIRFSYSALDGSSFNVEINQNGTVVYNKDVNNIVNDGLWYEFIEEDLNIEGEFQLIIKNTTDGGMAYPAWIISIKDICITANTAVAPVVPTASLTGTAENPVGGFWDNAIVTIASTREDASIYYTTDGSTPQETESQLYSAPFDLTATSTVKAIAVAGGLSSTLLDTLITVTPTTYHITAPIDATVFVGEKDKTVEVLGNYLKVHYVPFAEKQVAYTTSTQETKTYYYSISGAHNYRVSRQGSLTNVGVVTPSATSKSLEITNEQLNSHSPKELDRNVSHLLGRNVADLFININAQGHLTLPLKSDTTFQLIHTRNWQAINTDVDNYFIEPDFHYRILNESGVENNSVISISPTGLIKPLQKGTVIVQVTYDAMMCAHTTNVGNNGAAFFSALWPENTGTFVVTVNDPNASETNIEPNMLVNEHWNSTDNAKEEGVYIDAELDVLYYEESTGGYSYTFKPENVLAVTLAQPALESNSISYSGFSTNGVTKNDDGSYTIILTHGRNIIKLTSATESVYQVISAKPVNYTVSNLTNQGATKFQPGDEVSVQFQTLYHPSNKMSGIYNMSAGIQYTGPEVDFPLILSPNQYAFASGAQEYKITIPADFNGDEYVLDNGVIRVNGYGSTYGAHRNITIQNGVNPNLSASVQKAFFGSLPEIRLNTGVAPTVPTGLQAIPSGATERLIMWTASTDNVYVTGYNVYVDGQLKGTTDNTAYQLTGLVAGTTYKVEVEAFDEAGNKSVKAELNVTIAPEGGGSVNVTGVTLNHSTGQVTVGQTLQLTATVAPSNADNKAVSWTSSQPTVATVSSTGLVTAQTAPGTAIITVTTTDGTKTAQCTITTLPNGGIVVNPFELTQRTLSLYPNQTVTLALTAPQHFNVTWVSTNTSAATVSSSGEVRSIAAGSTYIIARDIAQGRVDTCTVTVTAQPTTPTPTESLTLNTSLLSLTKGDTTTLRTTTSSGLTGQTITWSSSGTSVATVASDGKVTATGSGTCIITAAIGNYRATCVVVVADPATTPDNNTGEVTVSNITRNEARLSFPTLSDASYYLVHLYKKTGNALDPQLSLKVTPDGTITLRSTAGSAITVPLNYLESGTSYLAEIETIRETTGKAEVINLKVVAFVTAGTPTGTEQIASDESAVWYSNGVLNLKNLAGSNARLYSINGYGVAMFRVNSDYETYNKHLPAGVYILTTEKNGVRKTLKFTVL